MSALASRSAVQARDIFDLYILSSQYTPKDDTARDIGSSTLKEASGRVFEVSFERFRDTVISYLSAPDQKVYDSPEAWDEIQIKTARFLDELTRGL